MNVRTYNSLTLCIAVLALLVSIAALCISWVQHQADYEGAVLIKPGTLPVDRINPGKNTIDLEVSNTSKSNLAYFLRAKSNIGFIHGPRNRPQFLPTGYESQIVSLSNTDAGRNSFVHSLVLDAGQGPVPMHPLAGASEPDYYFEVELVDARNGRILFSSRCYYRYHREAGAFGLDQAIIDTSGETERRQQACRS